MGGKRSVGLFSSLPSITTLLIYFLSASVAFLLLFFDARGLILEIPFHLAIVDSLMAASQCPSPEAGHVER